MVITPATSSGGHRLCMRLATVFIFRCTACVSDPKAARDIVFGPDGILKYINEKKSYVDMSTVDAVTTIGLLFTLYLNPSLSSTL